jgi:glycosyltransferase involved in cell wall biosynthesis
VRRRFADVAYGRALGLVIEAERPELVLSGNTPTEAQDLVAVSCSRAGASFVPWVQDFYSVAATELLTRRLGRPGRWVGAYYRRQERLQLARADAVVVITEQFRPLAERWCGDASKVFTIENWGHLEGLTPLPRVNAWSAANGIADGFNFVYCGTLGMKHDPTLLAKLAQRVAGRARVVVVGHGSGFDDLAAMRTAQGLDNLLLLPLQPFGDLPWTLASADVAVAVIEPQAGAFSVPSKVQSYLCAGRPVLLSSPAANLAAQVLVRESAGLVAAPGSAEEFLAAAEQLLGDAALRGRLGGNGRAYAERAYRIGEVADRFEGVFRHAMRSRLRAGTATPSPVHP